MADEFQSVHARHVECVDDDVDAVIAITKDRERGVAIGCQVDAFRAEKLEHPAESLALRILVFHDEEVQRLDMRRFERLETWRWHVPMFTRQDRRVCSLTNTRQPAQRGIPSVRCRTDAHCLRAYVGISVEE